MKIFGVFWCENWLILNERVETSGVVYPLAKIIKPIN